MISEELKRAQDKLEAYIIASVEEFEKETGVNIQTLHLITTTTEVTCGYLRDHTIGITYSKINYYAPNS
jgi:hypothetical protein